MIISIFNIIIMALLFIACSSKNHNNKKPLECKNVFILNSYNGNLHQINILEFNSKQNSIELIQTYQADGISEALYNCEYEKTLLTYSYRGNDLSDRGYEILSLNGEKEEYFAKDFPGQLRYYNKGVIVGTGLIQKDYYDKNLGDAIDIKNNFETFSYTHYIKWKDIFEKKSFLPSKSYRFWFSEEIVVKNNIAYGFIEDNKSEYITRGYKINLDTKKRFKTNIIYSPYSFILKSTDNYEFFFNAENINRGTYSNEGINYKFKRDENFHEVLYKLKENAIYHNIKNTPKLIWESNNTIYDYFVKEDDVYLFDSQNNIIKYSPLTNTKKIYPYPFKMRYKIATFLNDNFVFIFHTERRDEKKGDKVKILITDKNFHPVSIPFILEGIEPQAISTQNNQGNRIWNPNFGSK